MYISGFSFVRNAVLYDYPVVESITSILPLCDEFVLAVGRSDDETLELIHSIGSPKLRIIETVWDPTRRTGGAVLADQTNIALAAIQGKWGFYLQADEVVHENDLIHIENSVRQFDAESPVEGLLFDYVHFYGSYSLIGASRRWYRREIRIVRPTVGLTSWGDAQGFRINGRKMRVKHSEARIFHYGWVKPPKIQQAKQRSFNTLWHSDEWVTRNVGNSAEYDYSNGGILAPFVGSHPAVMTNRVQSQHWSFVYDSAKARRSARERLSDWVERRTGWRPGEYKNYELI